MKKTTNHTTKTGYKISNLEVKLRSTAVTILLVAVLAVPALAAQTQCPQHYYAGVAPDISNAQLTEKTKELCYSAFAVVHSGISRTPLWSAERLTRERLESAKTLDRINSFHAEQRLPYAERAELADYSRSGFDRGHLSPNADMPDRTAQQESFSLANIIPQDPQCNRNIFEWIESSVRRYAMRLDELYIITGPLFIGENIEQINSRVIVPTHIYKILYNPRTRRGGAYLVKNKPGNEYDEMTIAQIEKLAGIVFFPQMSASEKQKMLDLPIPSPRGGTGSHSKKQKNSSLMKWFLH